MKHGVFTLLDDNLYDKLNQEAQKERRSLSNMLNLIIEKHYEVK